MKDRELLNRTTLFLRSFVQDNQPASPSVLGDFARWLSSEMEYEDRETRRNDKQEANAGYQEYAKFAAEQAKMPHLPFEKIPKDLGRRLSAHDIKEATAADVSFGIIERDFLNAQSSPKFGVNGSLFPVNARRTFERAEGSESQYFCKCGSWYHEHINLPGIFGPKADPCETQAKYKACPR